MTSKDSKKLLIEKYSRRLQKLKEKQAFMGLNCPVEVLMEIEDIQREIEELQQDLEEVETTTEIPLQLPINTAVNEGKYNYNKTNNDDESDDWDNFVLEDFFLNIKEFITINRTSLLLFTTAMALFVITVVPLLLNSLRYSRTYILGSIVITALMVVPIYVIITGILVLGWHRPIGKFAEDLFGRILQRFAPGELKIIETKKEIELHHNLFVKAFLRNSSSEIVDVNVQIPEIGLQERPVF